MTKWLLATIALIVGATHASELWEHLSSASELEDVRDMAATFDDSSAQRVLQLNVFNPVSWQQGAWVAVPPPVGGWDLANVQNVEATIKNTGASAVETMLWVVASNGWSAVGSETTLAAGQTGTLALCTLGPGFTASLLPMTVAA